MASHNSSVPSYGVNPAINISASQLRESHQREIKLSRSCVPPQMAAIPPVPIPPTYPPGIILGEHLFSTRELIFRLYGTDNTSSITTRKRVNTDNSGMNSQDVDKREGTNGNKFDGRTHSLLAQEYGPYTCPRCDQVFPTSQHIAAHVKSHCRAETRDMRKQRMEANISKRTKNLRLHVSREGVTIVSDASKSEPENVVVQQRNYGSVKVETQGLVTHCDFPEVPPRFGGHYYRSPSGVIKDGPKVPPGFEGHHYESSSGFTIKREPLKLEGMKKIHNFIM